LANVGIERGLSVFAGTKWEAGYDCVGGEFPAAGFVLALVVLVLSVTRIKPPRRPCPRCGSRNVTIVPRIEKTVYHCNECSHVVDGPPPIGFSWTDAAMTWLGGVTGQSANELRA
jgi:ribosomal protein L37AE/L43A